MTRPKRDNALGSTSCPSNFQSSRLLPILSLLEARLSSPEECSGHSMHPPPTPLHRNVFPVRTERPRSLTSLRSPVRLTPVSQLLVAAVTVTVAKTLVLDDSNGETGGVGWLVLAYWVGKVEKEVKASWKKRGKGKEASPHGDVLGAVSSSIMCSLAHTGYISRRSP